MIKNITQVILCAISLDHLINSNIEAASSLFSGLHCSRARTQQTIGILYHKWRHTTPHNTVKFRKKVGSGITLAAITAYQLPSPLDPVITPVDKVRIRLNEDIARLKEEGNKESVEYNRCLKRSASNPVESCGKEKETLFSKMYELGEVEVALYQAWRFDRYAWVEKSESGYTVNPPLESASESFEASAVRTITLDILNSSIDDGSKENARGVLLHAAEQLDIPLKELEKRGFNRTLSLLAEEQEKLQWKSPDHDILDEDKIDQKAFAQLKRTYAHRWAPYEARACKILEEQPGLFRRYIYTEKDAHGKEKQYQEYRKGAIIARVNYLLLADGNIVTGNMLHELEGVTVNNHAVETSIVGIMQALGRIKQNILEEEVISSISRWQG